MFHRTVSFAALLALPALAHATVAAPAAKPATGHAAPSAQAPKTITRAAYSANLAARFNAVDTNHDGFLTKGELAAIQAKGLQQMQTAERQRLEAGFNKLDTNKDGKLSQAEFLAAAAAPHATVTPDQILAELDKNKDGKVSRDEYRAAPLANFDKLDAAHSGFVEAKALQPNATLAGQAAKISRADFQKQVDARFDVVDSKHQGFLDKSEIMAAQAKALQQAGAVQQQRMIAEFQKLDSAKTDSLTLAQFLATAPAVKANETPDQMLAKLDTNHDGKVSMGEYTAGPLANFDKLDTNHDGIVTAQELQAARKR